MQAAGGTKLLAAGIRPKLKAAPDRSEAQVITQAELQTILDSYTPRDDTNLPCETTVIEQVGDTYTVTESDGWKWEKSDLPRFDELGNEYTYYVVETYPSAGYETTYLGLSNGLHDDDTAIINNKSLSIS